MTREEAITELTVHLEHWKRLQEQNLMPTDECANTIDALRKAIEALSKPIVDITQRDLCADISCTDCPFMQETCKLMDYVAYADRPHGEWLYRWNDVECSECGEFAKDKTNFCPNCGCAMDMRKENKQL